MKINLKNWSDEKELVDFLNEGNDINMLFSCDRNALFTAPYEKAVLLIKYGINIFHRDIHGNTALMWNKDLEVCKLLIEKGLSIHTLDKYNQNALFNATPEKAKMFIDLGININQINKDGENALLAGRLNKTKLLYLIDEGVDLNKIDSKGENILFKKISPDVIEKALMKGANPNIINTSGKTPLFHASLHKAELLLKYGVNINQLDENGENALFEAGFETSKFLLDNGIDFNVINRNGDSVIFNQIHNMNKLELLKNKGCNLNQVNRSGNTILWDAGKYTIKVKCFVKLIEELEVDMNIINKKGENCAFVVSGPQLKYLISKGVDCNVRNNLGFDVTFNARKDKMKVILEESNYKPSSSGFHSLVNRHCEEEDLYKIFTLSVIAKGGINEEEFESLMTLRTQVGLPVNINKFKECLVIAENEILKNNINKSILHVEKNNKRL